jgi:Nif-specific regulatory protein
MYIPPLRQRTEDIPELVDFFLKKFCRETKKKFAGLADDAMEALLSYQWPGNVRELENAVERAVVMCKGDYIHAQDLLLNAASEPGEELSDKDLKSALNIFKKHFIMKALEENGGNQTGTAKALKIQRTYLSRLIKELEITISKE